MIAFIALDVLQVLYEEALTCVLRKPLVEPAIQEPTCIDQLLDEVGLRPRQRDDTNALGRWLRLHQFEDDAHDLFRFDAVRSTASSFEAPFREVDGPNA